ncbi:MAG: ATP-binding protein [Pseudomonadota bacterium]
MTADIQRILNLIEAPVWIFDFNTSRIRWSNAAACRLWNAQSPEELAAREMAADMSPSVASKLAHYREDLRQEGASFVETWTLYPNDEPFRVKARCRGFGIDDEDPAMLVEVLGEERAVTAENVRSVEAVLHTNVMISLYTADGDWLHGNPAARARFGSWARRLSDRFVDASVSERFLATIRDGGTADVTARVRCTDGIFWHEIEGKWCRDAVTGERAILVSESNVTAAQTARVELERARQEALEATQQKTDFLTTMSHEIRTPINGVIGLTQVLDSKISDPESRAVLAMIADAGESLLKIVNEVLDLSKIEAGQMEFEEIEFVPSDLLRKLGAIHQAKAMANGTALSLKTVGDAAQPRIGDPHRIMQVLNNLVNNAIRFSPDARVAVEIGGTADGPLTLSVSDTGIGMSEEQCARVFDSYVQADRATARQFGGTGLGLPITRGLIEAMGGTIAIQSSLGKGTEIQVSLPLRPSQRIIGPQASKAAAAEQDGKPIRVLAAEDNTTNQMVLRGLLRSMGVSIDIVGSGEEAIDLYKQDDFDLLMLDISMPQLDGIQTLHAIRRYEAERDLLPTPAIAVTANVFQHQVEAYLAAGFHEHLGKPLRTEALRQCIHRTLSSEDGRPE